MLSEVPFNSLSNKFLGYDILVKNEIGTFHLNNAGKFIFNIITLFASVLVYFGSGTVFGILSKTYQ